MPLMPTLFSDLAFWSIGEVRKNGEVIDKPRLVHGMLTEYVLHGNYELGFDEDVDPTARHFHVMVPAYMHGEDTLYKLRPAAVLNDFPHSRACSVLRSDGSSNNTSHSNTHASPTEN